MINQTQRVCVLAIFITKCVLMSRVKQDLLNEILTLTNADFISLGHLHGALIPQSVTDLHMENNVLNNFSKPNKELNLRKSC